MANTQFTQDALLDHGFAVLLAQLAQQRFTFGLVNTDGFELGVQRLANPMCHHLSAQTPGDVVDDRAKGDQCN